MDEVQMTDVERAECLDTEEEREEFPLEEPMDSPEEEPPKRKKKKIILATALVVAVVALSILGLTFGRYYFACYVMERENYTLAAEQFEALGNFMDAPVRLAEVRNMQMYLQAEELMDSEDYEAAYCIYMDLGNFLDAQDRRWEALHMKSVFETYQWVQVEYEAGEYFRAYEAIEEIKHEDHEKISRLWEDILTGLYGQMNEFLEEDEMAFACFYLSLLEEENYPPVDGLREKLVEEKHMELDTSYYDKINMNHITGINSATTAGEYASVIKYMYLNHLSRYTLWPNGSQPYYTKVWDRMSTGIELIDSLLPEYASVYDPVGWTEWDGYGNTIRSWVDISPGNAESMEEAIQHIQGIEAYCEETVRRLNEELLLTDSMSNQAKASVILDWVCNYLNYDDSKEIHDTYVAIENKIGVCECYVSIYNRMCNLAGVPTYGQIGLAGEGDLQSEGGQHIWSIQLDEEGNVFYTDPTWADQAWVGKGITISQFVELQKSKVTHVCTYQLSDSYSMSRDAYIRSISPQSQYFWQESIWDSHEPYFDYEQIQAVYQQNAD